jgi:hypothetical protein
MGARLSARSLKSSEATLTPFDDEVKFSFAGTCKCQIKSFYINEIFLISRNQYKDKGFERPISLLREDFGGRPV